VKEPMRSDPRGYGNIYTPHAGSMIIQVQREGGLANRTIVLSQRKVVLLRLLTSRKGFFLIALILGSWIYFAVQSVRVPMLVAENKVLQNDVVRVDSLQATLIQLHRNYQQLQVMLGLPDATARATAPGLPNRWPLETAGYVTRGTTSSTQYSGAHPGIDIAVPIGTKVLAAGNGRVAVISEDAEYGLAVRVTHSDGYETLYAHLSRVIVKEGQLVAGGEQIALSGNSGRSTAPHLHVEVRRNGTPVDPLPLIQKE
jgi:murein DD-endopeptidase MepM/ murein hydrolase activator NlpD